MFQVLKIPLVFRSMDRVKILTHGEAWKDINGKLFYRKYEKDDNCFHVKTKSISLNSDDLREMDFEYAMVILSHRGVFLRVDLKDKDKKYLNFHKETKIYVPVKDWLVVSGDHGWLDDVDWRELEAKLLKNRK